MPKKKDKIPPPGNKKDPYTNFMKKQKWQQVLRTPCLDIAGNAIQKEGAVIVANILNKNIFVEKLIITQTHLGDAGITEFAQMLKLNVTIREIHCGVNDITDLGGVMLASAFLINRTCNRIYAPGNTFGDDTACAWAFVLRSNPEIKHLDLSWNAIGYRGADALSQSLKKSGGGFSLELGQNRIGDEGCKYLCQATHKVGVANVHGDFNIWQNDIGRDGGMAVAELVEKNSQLTALNLSWNSMGSVLGPLCKALAVNQGQGQWIPRPEDEIKKEINALVEDGFRKQDEDRYTKGNESRYIIRRFWNQNPELPACAIASLNLSQNLVGDEGCEELAKLLAANSPYLKNINLSWNNITSVGAIAICEGLAASQMLEILNLAHNKINDDAAPAFAKVIAGTSTLVGLSLQRNELKDAGKEVISSAIPRQAKIRVNYGALDDMIPLTGVYGGTVPNLDERMGSRGGRRRGSAQSNASGADSSRDGKLSARRKGSRSRSTASATGSDKNQPSSP
mmetsp:Transcript_7744/g.13744  ORF Transcript_7744/g.13744 Transcript_7744/m.13744 type:complete len:509 (-) Transcript_7744:771-2297(-)